MPTHRTLVSSTEGQAWARGSQGSISNWSADNCIKREWICYLTPGELLYTSQVQWLAIYRPNELCVCQKVYQLHQLAFDMLPSTSITMWFKIESDVNLDLQYENRFNGTAECVFHEINPPQSFHSPFQLGVRMSEGEALGQINSQIILSSKVHWNETAIFSFFINLFIYLFRGQEQCLLKVKWLESRQKHKTGKK